MIWLWVATIELESKEILGINISKERNILLAERFISSLVGIHGQHPSSFHRWRYLVSTAQACKFLRLLHHIHSPYEKSIIIEGIMHYIKKIEPNALTTIFLAERRIVVNYYMCGIG
ncbi:MAG: hypothetical protein WBZ20_15230 [Nitrososphaeraceae archaeon]